MSKPPPIYHWGRYRTFGLLFLACACLRMGVAYTPLIANESIPAALRLITAIFPLWFLGVCWLLLTIAALLATVFRRWHDIVFTIAFSYTFYWMLAYVFAQFDAGMDPPYDATRAWNSAWVYLLFLMAIGFIGYITRLPKQLLGIYEEDEDLE